MHSPTIDFRRIRPHRGSQHTGFEELTRQLVLADPPPDHSRIEHRGPGADGGVEMLVWFSDGTCWGWQSKYFIDSFQDAQVAQLKDSFKRALATYARLTNYIIAMPRNLGGSGKGPKSDERKRWERFVTWATARAEKAERTVSIDLWDESLLVAQLTQPSGIYLGMLTYWFDVTVFTAEWFRAQFENVTADLGERYSPGDHVDVEVQQHLDSICRNNNYTDEIDEYRKQVVWALEATRKVERDARIGGNVRELAGEIAIEIKSISEDVHARDWIEASRIDLRPEIELGLKLYDKARNMRPWPEEEGPYHLLRSFDQHLEMMLGGPHYVNHDLLRRPVLLMAGEAGSGKSHALAHAVDSHLGNGSPALLLLGQYFGASDPWPQIGAKLGLTNRSRDEVLGALQAAALAAGHPCLIAIDALNEAEDPAIWRHHLAGFVQQIERFNRLAIVVSCRTTYESYCIPAAYEITRVVHRGFEGNAAEAAKIYLDKRGIDRPGAPFLAPEFTNPLFLSTSCKALEAQGKKAFPLGLDGLSDLFRFYVDGVQVNLVRQGFDRFDPGEPVVWNALLGFAEELALNGTETLEKEAARELLENHLYPPAASEHTKTFLFRLEDEGVLRRMPARGGGREEVTFTFQRFSDHFVAAAILSLMDTPQALASAMKSGGEFAHLTDHDISWRFGGVIEALMAQVPERFAVELVELEEDFTDHVSLPINGFIESLKLRAPEAVGPAAVHLFERLASSEQISSGEYFETLLEVSSQPHHRLNAEYLHVHLSAMSMPDRDASWSHFLFDGIEREGPVSILIDWAGSVDVTKAEPERLRLVALVLSWFFTTSDRSIRDRATKALVALFYQSPDLIAPTIHRFVNIDDPYVRERVLAAAYGALLTFTKVMWSYGNLRRKHSLWSSQKAKWNDML